MRRRPVRGYKHNVTGDVIKAFSPLHSAPGRSPALIGSHSPRSTSDRSTISTPAPARDSQPRKIAKICPDVLWSVARLKLDALDYAARLVDLRYPPGNRLEPLKGDRKVEHRIRDA